MLERQLSPKEKLSALLSYGYSQKELAKKLGISQASVHKIKTGKTADCLHTTALNIEMLYSLELRKSRKCLKKKDLPNESP